jgi:hypothetical protein
MKLRLGSGYVSYVPEDKRARSGIIPFPAIEQVEWAYGEDSEMIVYITVCGATLCLDCTKVHGEGFVQGYKEFLARKLSKEGEQ